MSKLKITISLDADVYYWVKSNVQNMSQETNHFWRSRMQFFGTESQKKKSELQEMLENHKKLAEQEMQQVGLLQAQLQQMEAQEKAEYDEKFQEALLRAEAMRRTGFLGKLGLPKGRR